MSPFAYDHVDCPAQKDFTHLSSRCIRSTSAPGVISVTAQSLLYGERGFISESYLRTELPPLFASQPQHKDSRGQVSNKSQ